MRNDHPFKIHRIISSLLAIGLSVAALITVQRIGVILMICFLLGLLILAWASEVRDYIESKHLQYQREVVQHYNNLEEYEAGSYEQSSGEPEERLEAIAEHLHRMQDQTDTEPMNGLPDALARRFKDHKNIHRN